KELITTGRDVVRLNVEACWIDALAALALDPAALEVPHDELLALCRGELLEGLDGASASFDRWLTGERARVSGQLQGLLARELERTEAKSNAARALKRALADLRERARMIERRKEQWQAAAQADARAPAAGTDDAPGSASTPSPSPRVRDRLRVGVLPFLSHT